MPDVSTVDLLLRLLACAGLGAALGLERELSAQPAGFRTHLLVALGAGLFTVGGADVAGGEPTRVAAQVVTGIGFLGAGAILRDGGSVKGLTTAGSLWVTAAVGLACGLGEVPLAAAATGLALVALVVLKRLERTVFPRHRDRLVELHLDAGADLPDVAASARDVLGGGSVRRVAPRAGGGTTLVLRGRSGRRADGLDLAVRLRALPGVTAVDVGP